jgi:hypothetical protein
LAERRTPTSRSGLSRESPLLGYDAQTGVLFPHFGAAAGLMYLPAKFRIRFLEPIDLSEYGPDDADDIALVGRLSERIRLRIQEELDDLVLARRSVWFG